MACLLDGLFAGMPAQALGIANAGERQFLRIAKQPSGLVVEQSELLLQVVVTIAGQGFFEIFDHCSQPTHDLEIICSAGPYLAESEIDEVLPIGRPEYHTQLARSI